ncbi:MULTISPECIES: hypothetical protein [Streptomyces]|uniref:Uncharacterized protein n=1 Tax=Streptomyces liliiviolaceus TaxID=2823109 RepID=A0A940XTZ5_9ACTN|nr:MULTISPECIES: hypothetical protein [Streptomyces]MBQ0847653.1 hypothetical protein [Streptomyces liliiviolaceus]MBQ0850141.1 hypothetical protein [Streptomyces liliiviolaceus]MCW8100578.1 hypothetical protein [Streptomyces tauricus]
MSEREILDSFPAGHPRGSWPAEERAAALREQGESATVVMDLDTDSFLIVSEGAAV